jgi:hypothetical protein
MPSAGKEPKSEPKGVVSAQRLKKDQGEATAVQQARGAKGPLVGRLLSREPGLSH